MARPPLRPYQQQSSPQSRGTPYLRPVDTSSGDSVIASRLASAGQAVARYAQVRDARDAEVEAELAAQRRDDARIYVSQRMAQARMDALTIRRETFEQAPDGFRGATESASARFNEMRQRYLADESLSTPEAKEFLGLALGEYESDFLGNVAVAEMEAQGRWQQDAGRSTVDTASSVLAADPGQYAQIRDNTLAAFSGISDADMRRDLIDYAESQFAVTAVGALVERDPHGVLRGLRDPESGGPYSRLTGPQRNAAERSAQAEINRRNAEARAARSQYVASIRDAYTAQRDTMQRTGQPPNSPLDLQVIAETLGPDSAQAYLGDLAGVDAASRYADAPMEALALIAGRRVVAGEGSDIERIVTAEEARTVQSMMTRRREDPGQYLLETGQMRGENLMAAIEYARQSGDWSAAQTLLNARGADAMEARRNNIVPQIAPLSRADARGLADWLTQQTAQNRLGFFSQAANAMDRDAYIAMMTQIAPDGGEVIAYAGARFVDHPTLSRRLLEGAELLQGGNRPGEDRQRRAPLQMPSENALRTQWVNRTGEAYARLPDASEAAYAAYRAYYAARSVEDGDIAPTSSNIANTARAREAVGAATGGIVLWSGRQTLMPAGMRAPAFEPAVRQAFAQYSFLAGEDPRQFQLSAVGGNNRYVIEDYRNPVTGEPVYIELRR